MFSVGEIIYMHKHLYYTKKAQLVHFKNSTQTSMNVYLVGFDSCCEQLKFNLINQITLLMDFRKDWLASKRR